MAQQRHTDFVGQRLTATHTEQCVRLAVVTRKRTHVFDHARYAQEAAPGHIGGSAGHLLCGQSGRGDDDQIGARQHARETHLHVAGARWHVDDEVIHLAPRHVAQKLLDGLGEHEPTPHQGGVFVDQESGAHDLEFASADLDDVGNDLGPIGAFDCLCFEPIGDAEQARNREAPDVGVEHANDKTLGRESGSHIDSDRALANPALAAGDRKDSTRLRHLGVGGVFAGCPACLEHDLAAFVAVHLAPLDAHIAHLRMKRHARFDIFFDLGAQWAAANSEFHPHRDIDATG